MRDSGFKREERVTELRNWIDTSKPGTVSTSMFDALRTRFQKHTESIVSAIEARSKDRLKLLGGTLESRKQREVEDMVQILGELAKNIQKELTKEEPEQLSFFTEDERTQVRRDRLALEARLRRIPEESEHERIAIESRYSALVDHTFPGAVILFVPESQTRGGR